MAMKFIIFAAFVAAANAQYYSAGIKHAPLSYARTYAAYARPYIPLARPYAAYAHATLARAHAPVAVARAPVAVARAPVAVAHHAPVVTRTEEYGPNHRYSYSYSVNDAHTGDNKGQTETRDGDVVTGSYYLVEADGSRRIVNYTADPVHGFNAVVHREAAVAQAPAIYY